MIADSIAFCREQGKRVDLRRRALLRRLPRRHRLRAGMRGGGGRRRRRERHPLRHQRRQPAELRRRGTARRRRRGRRRVEIGIHTHDDAGCGVANSLAAVEAGARLVQGCDQRLRRALRQRQPDLDPAGAAAEDGLRGGRARAAGELTPTAHYLDELCNLASDPDRPYVGRNAFAHKAGMHAAGVAADAQHLRAPRSGPGRQRARHPRLGAGGQSDDPQPGRARRYRAGRRGGGAGGRAAEAARAPRLPLRGRAGLLRAAAAARGRHLQAALPARKLPRRRRKARRRRGRRPRRRSKSRSTASATSRRPRATARSTRSTKPCEGRSSTATRTSPTSS